MRLLMLRICSDQQQILGGRDGHRGEVQLVQRGGQRCYQCSGGQS